MGALPPWPGVFVFQQEQTFTELTCVDKVSTRGQRQEQQVSRVSSNMRWVKMLTTSENGIKKRGRWGKGREEAKHREGRGQKQPGAMLKILHPNTVDKHTKLHHSSVTTRTGIEKRMT